MNAPRTRRQTLFFAAWFLVSLGSGAVASRTATGGIFRTGTNLVLINATVLDQHQRPVRGLTRDHFRLFEGKVEQRISYFGEEEMPLSLAILFDTSGSMEGKVAGATRAVSVLLNHPASEDEFALIPFADRAELSVPWTPDAADVQNHAAALRPRGNTALLDAVHLALNALHRARNPRRAVVILSDGGDNHSRHSEREILRMLEEADVQVYAIDMSPAAILRERSPEEVQGPDLLARICNHAGGRYWQVDGERELAETGDRIAREMRSQYVLGYAPADSAADGRFRKVRLQLLLARGQSAYWRRGYRSPAQ